MRCQKSHCISSAEGRQPTPIRNTKIQGLIMSWIFIDFINWITLLGNTLIEILEQSMTLLRLHEVSFSRETTRMLSIVPIWPYMRKQQKKFPVSNKLKGGRTTCMQILMIWNKKKTDIMLILHLTNWHGKLSHRPAQRVKKPVQKGCKEFFIMDARLPKQNLEKAPPKIVEFSMYIFPLDKG